jgi:aryl-alcohol dehydrogenase-like predicted oxidoreductase
VGTWQWGDRLFWGYGQGYAEAELRGVFQAALAGGLTLFDTAEIYGRGRSERLLGQFLGETGATAMVATKCAPLPWRLRPHDLHRALRGSLDRLGLERVGLYQMHWSSRLLPPERWMAAMAEVHQAGLVEAVGVSNYSAEWTRRAQSALAARGVPLASNQVSYSLLQRRIERNGVLETCRALGVTVIAYSPLGMGLLGGRYSATNPPSGLRRRYYRRFDLSRLETLVGLLREIGQAHGGKTPTQVALNWLLCQNTLPIPGAKYAWQIQEQLGALGWRLTPDDLDVLDRATAEFG